MRCMNCKNEASAQVGGWPLCSSYLGVGRNNEKMLQAGIEIEIKRPGEPLETIDVRERPEI